MSLESTKIDFPALFGTADETSRYAQNKHFLIIAIQSGLSIMAVLLSLFWIDSSLWALLAAAALVCLLLLSVFQFIKNYEVRWYNSRAIAESIKTISWRFMTRARPFQDDHARETLRTEILEILRQNAGAAKTFSPPYAGGVVSPSMLSVRSQNLDLRRQTYLVRRVDDQYKWYVKNTSKNKSLRRIWFAVTIISQGTAIALSILRILHPGWNYWPVDLFVVIGTSALGWTQARRHQDLEAAYSLTANEISVLRDGASSINTEDDLSAFVQDAENAFSREHTQWLARKDHKL